MRACCPRVLLALARDSQTSRGQQLSAKHRSAANSQTGDQAHRASHARALAAGPGAAMPQHRAEQGL